ncbi:MAG: HAMP domain-containing protein, partial [Thermoflexales bacterium]|nr:HAMP domain-containing protein [Thermoflexales bacterium]
MDIPLTLSIGAFAYVSVPLFIVGLISTYYLVRFSNKIPATWFMIGGLGGLTLSMLVWFLSTALVLWGVALYPATNAAVVLAMAAVIGFLYHYPQPVRSLEARVMLSAGIGLTIASAGYSLWFAYRIAIQRDFGLLADPANEVILGAAMLLALGATVRRIMVVRRIAPDRVRALRSMALALVFGLVQATASGLGMSGLLPMPLDMFIIGLSLLAMEVVLVYSTWDHAVHQPVLITRLIGLSLVTVLALLGAIGLFEVHGATLDSEANRLMETEIARRAVQAQDLTGLPRPIVSVLAVGPVTTPIYQRADQIDLAPLLAEAAQRAVSTSDEPALWGSQYDYYLDKGKPLQLPHRYVGQHPAHSYYQYLGYPFTVNGATYEAVFSEAETNAPIHLRSQQLIGVVIVASLFVVLVFPVFFRRSLVVPLENLLRGVRQANAGDLNVRVPITNDDELGYLTQSFNTMTASIKDQIEVRQMHETALRDLTTRLEQRVADRTRDLTVLYEVSSAANRGTGLIEVLDEITARVMTALNANAGFIHLSEETSPRLQLAVQRGLSAPPAVEAIPAQTLAQRETVFIADV